MAKMYMCVTKCKHGKIWNPGDKTTDVNLKALANGKIPSHFAPVDSEKAQKVVREMTLDAKGFQSDIERINYLRAKGLHPKKDASTEQLQEMLDPLS